MTLICQLFIITVLSGVSLLFYRLVAVNLVIKFAFRADNFFS